MAIYGLRTNPALGVIGRHALVINAQSAGAFAIDVKHMKIDALCMGHKWLLSGYGSGFVYLSRELDRTLPRSIGWLSVDDPFRNAKR
jgi:selenocysteine lyase/cysteine desulfurase